MIAFQSKADHQPAGYTDTLVFSCALDLDPMTLIYKSDLHILKMYLQDKIKLYRSSLSKVTALQTDRQTDGRTDHRGSTAQK